MREFPQGLRSLKGDPELVVTHNIDGPTHAFPRDVALTAGQVILEVAGRTDAPPTVAKVGRASIAVAKSMPQ